MLAFFSAVALLPLYPGEARGEWSANHRFVTELYGDGATGFCVLRSAIDQSSNGIEYRVGLAFGARNELSLATTNDGLTPNGPITLSLDDAEYTFAELAKEAVNDRKVMRWSMSRSMMAKLLAHLKAASTANIVMRLKFGDVEFAIPTTNAAATFSDAKACEDHRLGRVLPD